MLGEIAGSWDGFQADIDETYEQGDTVIVLGHAEWTAKSTGRHVKFPFVHVWRMSGGKTARVLALTDTLLVAQALGVAEAKA